MTDIALYSLDADGTVVFGLKNMPRLVSGPEAAVQMAAYHLFASPRANGYDVNEGGGLQKLIRDNMPSVQEAQTQAAIAIGRAMANIRRAQAPDLRADETITGLRLLSTSVDRERLEIKLNIRIDLMDGNSFRTTFKLG